jgi:hypothetical protein
MASPVLKLAAAAAVASAAVLGLIAVFTPSAAVAWGQIPDRVATIDSFVFSLTIQASDAAAVPIEPHTAQWIFYLSEERGFRMDVIGDGNVVSWFVRPEGDTLITVIPAEKTWFETPIPEEQRGKMPEEYKDPADYIDRFLARPYRELGQTVIDGVEVEGVEVNDPPTDGEQLDDAVGRLWVDAQTELPVRIEIEGTAETKTVRWQMDFKWSDAVDPEVFEPNIPDDFSVAVP